ncbi:MAG: hypothetical protein AB7P69_14860 [Candidatus Binatia bacterium]
MQVAGASFAHTPELKSFLPPEGYPGAAQANFLSASSRKSTDISLVTAEGDKVTISAKSVLQAGFVGYDYRGRLNGNEVSLSGRSLQVSAENSFAISVEGDLSKEELADIQNLVAKIEKLGSDFFSQPLEDSLAKTLEVGDLDSIASFAANLRYEQQLTIARVTKEEIQVPSASSTAPHAGQLDFSPISEASVKNFVKKLLNEVRNSHVDGEKAAQHLPQFLSKLFKKLAQELTFDEPKLKLADHIHQEVTQGLEQLAEQEPTLAAA